MNSPEIEKKSTLGLKEKTEGGCGGVCVHMGGGGCYLTLIFLETICSQMVPPQTSALQSNTSLLNETTHFLT